MSHAASDASVHGHGHGDGDGHSHVGKAHSHVHEGLQLQTKTGRVSLQILATLVGGVLLICSVFATLIFEESFAAESLGFVAAVLLGTPLVLVAVQDLLRGHTHMNELVALGVLAAFAIGKYQEAAAIAFFMIISVLIENRTALGAQASIESLVRITPTRAWRLKGRKAQGPLPAAASERASGTGATGESGGGEVGALMAGMSAEADAGAVEADGGGASGGAEVEEVEARDLEADDIVRVQPGDNIPADGIVLRGASTVNQATITGESLPADKSLGDEVYGGTINLTGEMDIRVTKAGEDTTLGRVKELILQAESTRIPIMRMIDQYAGWYTPTILMLVAIVLFFSVQGGMSPEDAMGRAIAMLVIACPCALILATPTAMVAALSSAARLGVLVKDVVDLEAARNLTAIVFDKTGTLTTGELEVTRLAPMPGVDGARLLKAAGSAEQHSRHPVARAVTKVAMKARLKLTEAESVEEISGRGVRATIEGKAVLVGRGSWIPEAHGGLSAEAAGQIEQVLHSADAEGLSVLFVVEGDELLGWIGLADNTRPEAAAAIDKLREEGLKRLIIVTGDRESVAKRVAAQMHTDYKAEVLPGEKLELVDALKAAGHRVAVIGDGVNDAPALAAGDISIAMGAAGSDVAIHSAKVALMNNNLNRIPFLIDLSRQSSLVIWQNLVFAALFIVVTGVFAATGFVGPIAAAVLHLGSGLVVIFNSARLVRSGEALEHSESEGGGSGGRAGMASSSSAGAGTSAAGGGEASAAVI